MERWLQLNLRRMGGNASITHMREFVKEMCVFRVELVDGCWFSAKERW